MPVDEPCVFMVSSTYGQFHSFLGPSPWLPHRFGMVRPPSRIHGRGHTLRVMTLAGRLHDRLLQTGTALPPTHYRDLMTAALIHDLGRRHDGVCQEHGLWACEGKRGIAEEEFLGRKLPEDDWARIAAAVDAHARPDPSPPWPRGSLTALLKDADGLDRVRLREDPDPAFFRHPFTAEYLGLAKLLLARSEDDLEAGLFG